MDLKIEHLLLPLTDLGHLFKHLRKIQVTLEVLIPKEKRNNNSQTLLDQILEPRLTRADECALNDTYLFPIRENRKPPLPINTVYPLETLK